MEWEPKKNPPKKTDTMVTRVRHGSIQNDAMVTGVVHGVLKTIR